MGHVYGEITLRNPVNPELQSIAVKCLVDTGSTYLVLPAHIAAQLDLKSIETRQATIADGSLISVPYAGPVQVSFGNRNCFVGTLVMGDEVLLGAVPMEDMDLVVHPKFFKLSANPESPDVPRGMVKRGVGGPPVRA